ncbi:uncharacterized protein [Onthophagus taurus]|uniref:uncharacterized protein n=1 Tax=Onthophagus taurus TaxID=166361 RepID=UPI0039BDB5FB
MYFVLVMLFACLIQVEVHATTEKMYQIAADCMDSSHVDPDEVAISLSGTVTDSPEFKQFLECFFETVGFLHDNVIDFDAILLHLDYLEPVFPHIEDLSAAVLICKEKMVHGSTMADTIFSGFKCFVGAA